MKDFKDIKIVGCIMMHDDEEYAQVVLDELAKWIKEIYVNLNDPTFMVENIVMAHPKVVKIIRTTNNNRPWNQALIRELTLRMLDSVAPDLVLFPDSDEVYPDNLTENLKNFWESPYECLWFCLAYLWDKPDQIRRDGLFKSMHAVRAFKWRDNLTFLPHCGYGAKPSNTENIGYKFHSNMPIKHYGYMTEKNRIRKYTRWGDKSYLDKDYRNKVNQNIKIINT